MNKRAILNSIGCVISLVTGGFIYILFREKTYISQFIVSKIELGKIRQVFAVADVNFLKYYFVDFLWSFSFSCCVQLITDTTVKCEMISLSVVAGIGIIYELLQFCNVVSGTGDIVDIMLYVLAACTVSILNLLFKERKK